MRASFPSTILHKCVRTRALVVANITESISRQVSRPRHSCRPHSFQKTRSSSTLAVAANNIQHSRYNDQSHPNDDDDEANRLRDVTRRLLCPITFPVGFYTISTWMHAESSIYAWAWAHKIRQESQPKVANVAKALEILERLVQEAAHNNKNDNTTLTPTSKDHSNDDSDATINYSSSVDTVQTQQRPPNHVKISLVNALLEGWRDCRKQGQQQSFSLAFMWSKICLFRSLVPSLHPDATTYKLLLDCIGGGTAKATSSDSPELAETILSQWVQERRQQGTVHLAPVDANSIQSVVHAWEASGRPEAATKVQALLQIQQECVTLVNFGENNNNNNIIDADDFQILLLDCCRDQGNGGFDKAQRLLDYMVINDIPTLSTHSVNTALTALLQKPDCTDALPRAKALVHRLNKLGISPDHQTYDILLTLGISQSRSSNHLLDVQEVLNEVLARFESGDVDLYPDLGHFRHLLQEWARVGEPLHAESLMERLFQTAVTTNSQELLPDASFLALVLEAWLHSGRRDAMDRAQALMGCWMINPSTMSTTATTVLPTAPATDRSIIQPCAQIYAVLMEIWRHSRRRDRAEQAQAVFDEMVAQYRKEKRADLQPNERHYVALSQVWAEVGNVKKAESVLLEMSRVLYANEPNAHVTVALMEVWALARQENAGERSQVILEGMLRHYDHGFMNLKPTREFFRQLMNVWRQSVVTDRAEKAQACFDIMCTRSENGDVEFRPDLDTYNTLFAAWASVGQVDKVQQLMEEMRAKYNLEPDLCSVAALIDAWSNSDKQDALEQAHSYSLESLDRYKSCGQQTALPQSAKQAYYSVMSIWARQSSVQNEQTAMQIQSFWDEMKEMYEHGNFELRPDGRHYSIAIDAWLKAGCLDKAETLLRHSVDKECIALDPLAFQSVLHALTASMDGAERADEFVRWVVLSTLGEEDNYFTTTDGNKVLLAWSKQHEQVPNVANVDRALSFLTDIMEPHYYFQPNADSYEIVLSMIMKSSIPDKLQLAERLVRHMTERGVKPHFQ